MQNRVAKICDKKRQQREFGDVSVMGRRLKSAREGRGISLREFAKELRADFTRLARIERGHRYPPKRRLEKFAKELSLTPAQLEALVAVERRGLNPHELLPEIPPAHIVSPALKFEGLTTKPLGMH
jgi:transcriptional regulator with XRE-family HTH domain